MPRVLIVDDSRVVLSIVQTYLAELDVSFDVATSAEAALLRFRESPPDLIVTDVMMPGMNGIEFARRIKALSSGRVKVVLISSVARDEGTDAVDRGDVEAFIHKPIDGDELCNVVANLLGLPRRRHRVR